MRPVSIVGRSFDSQTRDIEIGLMRFHAALPFALATAAAICATAVFATVPARASDPAEESLKSLYRIALSAEVCEFVLPTREANAVGKAMNQIIATLSLDEDKAEAFYLKVEAEMQAEGWDKLCAKNGQWAQTYRQLISSYAKK